MMARDQRDHYWRKAKEEGYRARSAYKLLQINEKFHVIKRGDSIVDLEEIEPIPGVITLRSDITQEKTFDLVKEVLGGAADVVICDAAPNLSGAWDRDHAVSIDLARSALHAAKRLLKPRGNFVVKVFQGDMFPEFLAEVKREFALVQAHTPAASRKESAETYIVAKKLLSSPVRKGDILDVQIEFLGRSGDGVAMVDGFAIIVRQAKLGERLRIKIDAVKPNFAFAQPLGRKD